jgi:hypothetical protein
MYCKYLAWVTLYCSARKYKLMLENTNWLKCHVNTWPELRYTAVLKKYKLTEMYWKYLAWVSANCCAKKYKLTQMYWKYLAWVTFNCSAKNTYWLKCTENIWPELQLTAVLKRCQSNKQQEMQIDCEMYWKYLAWVAFNCSAKKYKLTQMYWKYLAWVTFNCSVKKDVGLVTTAYCSADIELWKENSLIIAD